MAKAEQMEAALMDRVEHETSQVVLPTVLKLGHQQQFEKSYVPVPTGDQRLVSQNVQRCWIAF